MGEKFNTPDPGVTEPTTTAESGQQALTPAPIGKQTQGATFGERTEPTTTAEAGQRTGYMKLENLRSDSDTEGARPEGIPALDAASKDAARWIKVEHTIEHEQR